MVHFSSVYQKKLMKGKFQTYLYYKRATTLIRQGTLGQSLIIYIIEMQIYAATTRGNRNSSNVSGATYLHFFVVVSFPLHSMASPFMEGMKGDYILIWSWKTDWSILRICGDDRWHDWLRHNEFNIRQPLSYSIMITSPVINKLH